MTDKTMSELVDYVQRTMEVDDSGDANWSEYLYSLSKERADIRELFIGFLVWANGTNWEKFLDVAEVGDVPPKEPGE